LEAFTMNVRVWMQTLTEYGGTDRLNGPEDEVYLIVTTRMPDGKSSVARIPEPYWNMHPHVPAKQHISDITLWSGDLSDGQTLEVGVVVADEDDKTDLKGIAEKAIAAADDQGSWIIQVLKSLTSLLENQDDVIGAFTATFTVRAGQLESDWRPAHVATKGGGRNLAGGPGNPQYNAVYFEMRGADSLFFGYFRP
jgi:hypothetical protein